MSRTSVRVSLDFSLLVRIAACLIDRQASLTVAECDVRERHVLVRYRVCGWNQWCSLSR